MEIIVPLTILGIPVLLVLVWAVAIYNRFAALRNHIRESWAGISVELQRRYDLIPNLVETVKAYAAHEKETLERVVELRGKALANTGAAESRSADERALESAIGRVIALAESYPDLRADRHFLELQAELVNTEDRLAATRRFYNANVREYQNLRQQFPTTLIAGLGGFGPHGYFELEDDRARAAPDVSMR